LDRRRDSVGRKRSGNIAEEKSESESALLEIRREEKSIRSRPLDADGGREHLLNVRRVDAESEEGELDDGR
jgi:hypothetical protein